MLTVKMPFTQFVRPGRAISSHEGYNELEIVRITGHTCKVAENALCVSNKSSFPIIITIKIYVANTNGTYISFCIVNNANVPPTEIYSHASKLTLFAGDYLTIQALDQEQPNCGYTTALFWDELMMT